MVAALSAEAWALTGAPLPSYARHEAPLARRAGPVGPPLRSAP
jgi:hypothetical protein